MSEPTERRERNLHLYLQHQNHHTVLQTASLCWNKEQREKTYKAIIQNLYTKQSNNNRAPSKSYTKNWCWGRQYKKVKYNECKTISRRTERNGRLVPRGSSVRVVSLRNNGTDMRAAWLLPVWKQMVIQRGCPNSTWCDVIAYLEIYCSWQTEKHEDEKRIWGSYDNYALLGDI